MTHLLTITDRFLPVRFLPEGMAISVFIAVRKSGEDYHRALQRNYTVNQQSELGKTAKGYSRVILHSVSNQEIPAQGDFPIFNKRYIDFLDMTPEEELEELADADSGLEVSKPGGRPSWLQDPIYESPRHLFLMQILESDIAKESVSHEGLLAGGIGYLYVDRQARRGQENDEAGFFFIQFT